MVHLQKAQYKDLTGEWLAEVVGIEEVPNQFYKEEETNSTPTVLNISFELIDQVSWERTAFEQKFVRPTTFDKGLLQQLLDIYGFGPSEEGEDFDEQKLVGLMVMLTLDKNKNGYAKVVSAVKVPEKVKKVADKKAEETPDETPSDLPFP